MNTFTHASCDFVQGYFYSKPLSADHFRQYLQQTHLAPNFIKPAEGYQFSLLTIAEREQVIKLVGNFFAITVRSPVT